ncbi:MAG TPA: excinuclease ABC subunit UvrA, partial [Sorangium sp.]|nr:excinuclease ABC subunit UvrA [Sorangium sp.]
MVRELDYILIKGAREHNLRSVDIKIPKKKLVVFTGVSGSGKSSLAFDTLYAEGQRRYVESLSAYARQFLDKLDKPKYDTIRGLSPTIAIEQKTASSNPRSTVGTITELSDYLRVLYARVGVQHCHRCGERVKGQSAQQIATELLDRAKRHGDGAQVTLFAALLVNRKGEHRDMLEKARQDGWVRLRIDGDIVRSDDVQALDKRRKHTVHAVIDRVRLARGARQRLTESVEAALRCGDGVMSATIGAGKEQIYSEAMACAKCGLSFPPLTPQSFSFNSPQGMCNHCSGLGMTMAIDPDLVVPNKSLTLDEGAIAPWGTDVSKKTNWSHGFRGQFVAQLGIDTNRPWSKLSARDRKVLMYG